MIPAKLIAKKRDGHELSTDEIRDVIAAYAKGDLPEYQMAALAMAIYLRGMTDREIVDLTMAMVASGDTLAPVGSAPRVDKHSTGGLGDKTSLIIAPMLACLGFHVPMVSGRGLGITGGTLDKLEAIPGYRTDLSEKEISKQLDQIGCVITGATDRLVPADRKLYALRDVTATVPSIPLISASIMSKKIAESLQGLVLDVKFGSGSFQRDAAQARVLKSKLQKIGELAGVSTVALLSDMTQPLGEMIGNACEVLEAIDVLQGRGSATVRTLSIELSARLLNRLDPSCDLSAQRQRLIGLLESGEAFARFEQMVAAQGGDWKRMAPLEKENPVLASASMRGVLTEIDCLTIGYGMIDLGGGRSKKEDAVRPGVGIRWLSPLGTVVTPGQTLAVIYSNEYMEASAVGESIKKGLKFDSRSTREFPPLWDAN
ncbi:thymidine phosphorylase [Pirellulaceae bacterium SH467]|jgi:pyrimidine-nucleoside phosphorylase/thymidine phosphorylase